MLSNFWGALHSCSVALCVLLSGCELIEMINRAIRGNYRSSESIAILVIPPAPIKNGRRSSETKAFSFANSVRDGLMSGINAYNEKGSVTIVPVYFTKQELVNNFYDDISKILEQSEKDKKDAREEIKEYCTKIVFALRKHTEYKKMSCIIFGIYEFKESATAHNITLCYYDLANNNWSAVNGVVTKQAGRVQESDLQNLMKTLLKRVYD